MEVLVFRATPKIALLERMIKELDNHQEISRSAITNRAIKAAESVVDWSSISKELLRLKPSQDIIVPTSMQVKIDEENTLVYRKVWAKISADLNVRLQTPYFLTLIWTHYFAQLQAQAKEISLKEDSKSDLEIVAALLELLLRNREEDRSRLEAIKELLLK